jgi:hypothetical protein
MSDTFGELKVYFTNTVRVHMSDTFGELRADTCVRLRAKCPVSTENKDKFQ